MNGAVRKVGYDKDLIWYYRKDGGKGNKIFVSQNKAEEIKQQGISLFCRCQVKDLK